MRRTVAAMCLPVIACLWASTVLAADGEQWEYSGQVEMQGMKMAMPPTKTCQKSGAAPQPAMDKGCTVNSKLGPNGGTFSFKCPAPNAMEGQGELHFTADTMSATMKARSEGEQIVIQQTGRKTGRCNAPA